MIKTSSTNNRVDNSFSFVDEPSSTLVDFAAKTMTTFPRRDIQTYQTTEYQLNEAACNNASNPVCIQSLLNETPAHTRSCHLSGALPGVWGLKVGDCVRAQSPNLNEFVRDHAGCIMVSAACFLLATTTSYIIDLGWWCMCSCCRLVSV